VVRIFIGLLIGLIVGALGTIQYLSSGQGNVQLMTSPQIHQLEERVKQSNQQIEQLTKKLETAADAMEKTAARFGEIERKVETLHPSSASEGSPSSPPEAADTHPSPANPSSGSPPPSAEAPSPS
jgi:uncharacterized membrane-anchored protein YhcB (DUF1043 family)